MKVTPFEVYVVTTDSMCTVTDAHNGKILCTATAGEQKAFMAISPEIIVSDPAADISKPKANFKGALAMLGQSGGGVSVIVPPAGAIAVDYLESSGSQYIKTGYFGNHETGLRSVHQQVTSGNFRVAGTRDPKNENSSVLAAHHRNSAVGTAYGYAAWTNYDGLTTGWSEKLTGTTNYLNKQRAGTFVVGDSVNIQAGHENWGKTFSCTYELWLFAFNQGGSPANAFKGKIFEFQISQGEEVVRDYRPYISRDGEPFLWDAKTGGILKNEGTGAFRIGLSTVEQVRAVFNNLPNLSGSATPGELLIRLDESIATDEVRSLMDTICNSKNWGYVEA